MDESVAQIVGAAPERAAPLGLAPGRSGTDFIDRAHPPVLPACCWFFWDLPAFPGSATDRIGGVALTQAQHLSTGGLRNPVI
jgi:hypothetical protein